MVAVSVYCLIISVMVFVGNVWRVLHTMHRPIHVRE